MSKVVSVELLEKFIQSKRRTNITEYTLAVEDTLDILVDEIKSGRLSPASPPGVVEALRELYKVSTVLLNVIADAGIADKMEAEFVAYGIKEGFGVRAQAALTAEARLPVEKGRLPLRVEFAFDYLLGYMEGEPEEARSKLRAIADHLRPPDAPSGGEE
jgi:hypothetical protein